MPAVDRLEHLLATSNGAFHPLLRRIERDLRNTREPPMRVGFDGPAKREAVRLRAAQGAAFPAAEVAQIKPAGDGEADAPPYEIKVNFMGLTGPSGALPAHYTNTVGQRTKRRDMALADFLSLFDHRLLGLFHRAWGKYKPTIQKEGHAHHRGADPFTTVVDALSGQLRGRGQDARRYYAGQFARRTRSAAGLEGLLKDYLGHKVEVESLVGQWLTLDDHDRARLGSGSRGANNHLGGGVLTGRRCWNIDSRVAVHIGPLSHREHRALIPGSQRYRALQALINAYVPPNLTVDIHYHLADADERPAPLGRTLQLGRNSWLGGRNRPLSRSSVRLRRSAAA